MTDPTPAEILRRARPIPTYRDHPATSPVDIEGVNPSGAPARVAIVGAGEPVLLVFLSSSCLGCRDLWEGTAELGDSLPEGTRIVLVTKGPEREDADVVAEAAPAVEAASDAASAPVKKKKKKKAAEAADAPIRSVQFSSFIIQ